MTNKRVIPFMRLCDYLPESVYWQEPLTPAIVEFIVLKAQSEMQEGRSPYVKNCNDSSDSGNNGGSEQQA